MKFIDFRLLLLFLPISFRNKRVPIDEEVVDIITTFHAALDTMAMILHADHEKRKTMTLTHSKDYAIANQIYRFNLAKWAETMSEIEDFEEFDNPDFAKYVRNCGIKQNSEHIEERLRDFTKRYGTKKFTIYYDELSTPLYAKRVLRKMGLQETQKRIYHYKLMDAIGKLNEDISNTSSTVTEILNYESFLMVLNTLHINPLYDEYLRDFDAQFFQDFIKPAPYQKPLHESHHHITESSLKFAYGDGGCSFLSILIFHQQNMFVMKTYHKDFQHMHFAEKPENLQKLNAWVRMTYPHVNNIYLLDALQNNGDHYDTAAFTKMFTRITDLSTYS